MSLSGLGVEHTHSDPITRRESAVAHLTGTHHISTTHFRGMTEQAVLDVHSKEHAKDPQRQNEAVDHPSHYGGEDNPYEVIKVLEAWGLTEDAYLFNVIKYLARAGKKGDAVEDHKKARWYLDRKIAAMTAGVDQHGVVQ